MSDQAALILNRQPKKTRINMSWTQVFRNDLGPIRERCGDLPRRTLVTEIPKKLSETKLQSFFKLLGLFRDLASSGHRR